MKKEVESKIKEANDDKFMRAFKRIDYIEREKRE